MRVSFGHESQNIIFYIDVHVQVLLNAFFAVPLSRIYRCSNKEKLVGQPHWCSYISCAIRIPFSCLNCFSLLIHGMSPPSIKISCILLYLFGQVVNILHRINLQRCILSSLTFKCLCVSFCIFWEIGTWVRWHEDMNRMVSCKVAQFAFSFVL